MGRVMIMGRNGQLARSWYCCDCWETPASVPLRRRDPTQPNPTQPNPVNDRLARVRGRDLCLNRGTGNKRVTSRKRAAEQDG